jgi:hypothetical protein
MSVWKQSDWHDSLEYRKLCKDIQRYSTDSTPKCCGWTCLALTIILMTPIIWFIIDEIIQ